MGTLMNLCSLVVSEKPQPDPKSMSQLSEIFGCNLDAQGSRNAGIGGWGLPNFPYLFARFRAKTEASS